MANLLQNGAFAGPFRDWNGEPEISVATGWYPYWVARTDDDPPWRNRRPIYRAVSRVVEPHRIRTGLTAQSYYTAGGTFIAGLMQTVPATPGQRLRLSAYGLAWSSTEPSPSVSVGPTPTRMCVGIDPTGGTYPFAPEVVWSPLRTVLDAYDDSPFSVEATALATEVTVFLHAAPDEMRAHNAIFWDDARLEALAAPVRAQDTPTTEAMLVLEGRLPNPGREVLVYLTSGEDLANVRLSVTGPGENVGVAFLRKEEGSGRGVVWVWAFTPEEAGAHTAAVSADGLAPLEATIHIKPLRDLSSSDRGKPRTQYPRSYVLLPPNANEAWLTDVVRRAAKAWLRGEYTVGFNPDDGGVGDLDERRVFVVNPEAWPQPMADWYATYYPGVEVVTLSMPDPDDYVDSPPPELG